MLGPAGPLVGPPAPRQPSRPAAGSAGSLGRQDTNPRTIRARGQQKQAALNAKQGRPFNPQHLRGAIKSGLAPDVAETNGVFTVKHRRKFLPDTDILVRPRSGARYTGAPTEREMAVIGQKVMADPIHAPALKVLEGTTVPLHAIAGTAGGIGPVQGVKRKTTFGDVLGGGALGHALGLGLDIAADPTTYLTLGTGSVARRAALQAGESAARKATQQGLRREADVFRQRAVAQTLRKLPEGRKGLTVSFAGHELPGVRRATAALPRPRGPQGIRNAVADINPAIAPEGVPQTIHETARRVTRTSRASSSRGVFKAQRQAVALQRQIGKENYQQVIDAIEANDLRRLPDELHAPAKRLQDQFKYTLRLQRQSGIRKTHDLVVSDEAPTHAQGYFPHALAESLAKGKGFEGRGARKIDLTANKGRAYREPLATLRQTNPGLFSEDLPLVYANRIAATVRASNKATLNRQLAEQAGRPAKQGAPLGEHEALFRLHGGDLEELKGHPRGPQRGRLVVLDKRLVEHAHSRFEAKRSGDAILRGYDKAQGGFKRIATATPGFHVRNLIGDLQNAYLGQSPHQLAVNVQHAGRALARLSRHESRLSKDLHPEMAPSTKGVKIQGRHVSYDKLVQEAEKVGAIRQGYVARELEELTGVENKRQIRGRRVGQAVKRQMQNREDLARLATYIGARKRGLPPEKASEQVAKYHFDYGDLTNFERNVARRFLPFYTFSARNIPLQAKSLVSKPGKYANYEKIREEAAGAAGLQPGYEQNLTEYDQRNLGIPVNIGGTPRVLGLGLPLTDINEVPGPLGPINQAKEYGNRFVSLVTPLIKDPVELATNYSFFYRRAIENKDSPLVPAPSWVAQIPPDVRKKIGVVPDYVDKRTGKKTWGWPGKTNYLARTVPGGPALVQNLLTQGSRVGQSQAEKIAGAVTGVRIAPLDKNQQVQADLTRTYRKLDALNRERAIFNQRGIRADNATPSYERLSEQIKATTAEIEALKSRRGDKIISPGRRRRSSPAADLATEYGVGQSTSPADLAKEFGIK